MTIGQGLGPWTAERRLHRARRREPRPAVPPVQRRPVLRQPQRRPGRDLVGLPHQQQALVRRTGLDAERGQPRERGRQRPAGLPVVPDPVHAARQRLGQLQGQLVRVHGRRRSGSSHSTTTTSACRTARSAPSAGTTCRTTRRTATTPTSPATADGAQRAWLERELAAASRLGRHRLDRRLHAPGRDVLGALQRRRPGHQAELAAAVRQVRRRPGGGRARAPLRADLPGARHAARFHAAHARRRSPATRRSWTPRSAPST